MARLGPQGGRNIKTMKPKASQEDINEALNPHNTMSVRYEPRESLEVLKPTFDEGTNRKFVDVGLMLFNLPDINLEDEKQVLDRVNDYFGMMKEADMRPTVSGLGMIFNGIPWRDLRAIAHDEPVTNRKAKQLSLESKEILKRMYTMMESLWEEYMLHGRINPVTGIFFGKNFFNFQDKTEHVITAGTREEELSADDIRQRYMLSDGKDDAIEI